MQPNERSRLHALRRLRSIETKAGNMVIIVIKLNVSKIAVCEQNERNAGIGSMQPVANERMLFVEAANVGRRTFF